MDAQLRNAVEECYCKDERCRGSNDEGEGSDDGNPGGIDAIVDESCDEIKLCREDSRRRAHAG